jgi:regulatory protein
MSSGTRGAYLDALRMLARRELSEAQVRQRLARRQYPADAIDDAINRLRDERALDDSRVAEAIARTQSAVKGRGELRVRRQIEQAGIAPATARRAAREAFADLDPDELLETSLRKRLRGRSQIVDDAEFRRLHRYLIGQGFEPDRVVSALNRHKRRRS